MTALVVRHDHPQRNSFLEDIRSRRQAGETSIARALPASSLLLMAALAIVGLLPDRGSQQVAGPSIAVELREWGAPPRIEHPPVDRIAARPSAPARADAIAVPAPDGGTIAEAVSGAGRADAEGSSPPSIAGSGSGTAPVTEVGSSEPGFTWFERMPEVVRSVKPIYPELAISAQVEGTVQVWALVSKEGTVQEARIRRSIVVLDQAALDAVRQWRFIPARSGDQAVRAWVSVPIRFRLRD